MGCEPKGVCQDCSGRGYVRYRSGGYVRYVPCQRCQQDKPGKAVFTLEEAQAAGDEWGFNCGPGALCAVLGMRPTELRPHLLDFEQKRYTNPALMFAVLDGLGVRYRRHYRGDSPPPSGLNPYPRFGLVRVQWAGRWTDPGVPMRVRYRKTHWIAARGDSAGREIFDVNAMCVGGWISWAEWSEKLVPWLMRECVPGGDGRWWPTHGISIES